MAFKEELSPGEKLYSMITKVVIVKGRISTDPTVWEFHIEGEILKLTTDEMENTKYFRRQYLKKFNRPAPFLTPDEWINVLDNLADEENNKVEYIQTSEESSTVFTAQQNFEIVCDREISEDADDAENGRCLFQDVIEKDGNQYYCMRSDFLQELVGQAGFKIPLNELSEAMSELGFKKPGTERVWYNGKQYRRTFIKPCKKRPENCITKNCSECCSIRENENFTLMEDRR